MFNLLKLDTMTPHQKKNIVMKEVHLILRKHGYTTPLVCAEICGVICYLNEYEVRALQVMAQQYAQSSDTEFQAFCDNVIVYSGRYKRRSHKMEFAKDGRFTTEFDTKLFGVSDNLAMTLLRNTPRLK